MSDDPVKPAVVTPANNASNNTPDCPKSPFPTLFQEKPWKPIPSFKDDYYSKIPNGQLEEINAARTKALNTAEDSQVDANNLAEEAFQTASAEFNSAEQKQSRDKATLDSKIKNKKTEMRQNFRTELRGYLPKNCSITDATDKDIEDDDRVPRDKFAIALANFKKQLADAEIEYLQNLKTINDLKSDADNKWKKAREAHDANLCFATATKEQATSIAEITFRTTISSSLVC